LDTVLQKEPENVIAQELLISEYINSENWASAYDISSSLINKKKYSQEILLQHIKSCIKMNLSSEARSSLKLLNSLKVDNSVLELAEVQVLIAEGKRVEASNLIQKAISLYSGKVKSDFYFEKSRISANEEERLADLRLSLTANPRNPDALFALYKYYFDKADYRKAQYYLRQVVALNPENSKLTELNAQLDSLIK
jgi:Flp pilus assembly protein TadD